MYFPIELDALFLTLLSTFLCLLGIIPVIYWKMSSLEQFLFLATGQPTPGATSSPPNAEYLKRKALARMRGVPAEPFKGTVQFNWKPKPQVGFVYSFTIWYHKHEGGLLENLSEEDEELISIRVKRWNFNKEMLRYSYDETEEIDERYSDIGITREPQGTSAHVVKFAVKKAGTYVIFIKIQDCHLEGSPFFHEFLPGAVCPEKTILMGTFPPAVFSVLDSHSYDILGKDKFENVCEGNNIDTSLLKLTFDHVDSRESGQCLGEKQYEMSFSPAATGRMIITMRIHERGIYNARLEYDGALVKNGLFEVVVLSGMEMTKLVSYTHQHPRGPYTFEAEYKDKTITARSDSTVLSKSIYPLKNSTPSPRTVTVSDGDKVTVLLSPKNFIVNRRIMRLFTKRLVCGKVSLRTKMDVLSMDSLRNGVTIKIADGISAKVELYVSSEQARMTAGVLYTLLLEKLGNAASFGEKLQLFYRTIRNAHQDMHYTSIALDLCINRSDLLLSALRETQNLGKRDWFRIFKVNFLREPGVDGGGIRREFFELLCTQLFETSGLFTSMGDSRLVHPNPEARQDPRWKGKNYDRVWEFAGKVVGKCLFESAMGGPFKLHVKAKFTRSFLAQIVGLKPNYMHFEKDDPSLYEQKVKYILDNDVTNLDLYFTDSLRLKGFHNIDLVPNGSKIPVTERNKELYLNAMAIYRLKTIVQREIVNFNRGLFSIVPEDAFSVFDENELELLVCGKSTYSVLELQKYHDVGYEHFDQPYLSTHSKIMGWFWTVVTNMTEEEKARLLQFITGSSILPSGGLRGVFPKIEIKPVDEFGRLPVAHTCVNALCLPNQPDFETFEKRLILAITEGCEGFEFI